MPIKTEHRLSVLETNFEQLNDKVDEIANNHLVHLQAAIDKVDNKVWYVVVGVILSILVQIAFKLW